MGCLVCCYGVNVVNVDRNTIGENPIGILIDELYFVCRGVVVM